MKIVIKLTLRYTAVMALVFTLFVLSIFLFGKISREKKFSRDLKKETVTKANLFLESKVDEQDTRSLTILLAILWLTGLAVIIPAGYFLVRGAMSPVARIVNEVESITESNLDAQLPVKKRRDELDGLSLTFNEMLDRLTKSFDSQKMFVSNVSHELRTPLASMIAELEFVSMRERTNCEYRAVIRNVLGDALRMERFSKSLIDLARAGYDPAKISKEDVRLDEALLDARNIVLKNNIDYRINLIFDQTSDNEEQITVFGNEYLLKTAFINLMENNCKFSDNKTSIINISFWEDNSIVRFSNTGHGISQKDIEKIFEPFYRGENGTRANGHGVGMTLVNRIIMLHKGSVKIRSSRGEGTVFVISLPHI